MDDKRYFYTALNEIGNPNRVEMFSYGPNYPDKRLCGRILVKQAKAGGKVPQHVLIAHRKYKIEGEFPISDNNFTGYITERNDEIFEIISKGVDPTIGG